MLRLFSYFRSSAAYRVRIALNLKRLPYATVPIHLLRDGGENNRPEYLARNPLGLVPTLETENAVLIQSLPIIEYLEELHPDPPLLPAAAADRAWVRALAQTIASEIHPLNNLRVLDYLMDTLKLDAQGKLDWYHHWIHQGLMGVEKLLQSGPRPGGACCYGEQPTLADCCLIPQVYNARRFQCALEEFPRVVEIAEHCNGLPAFVQAAPENQPDAE